jgi:hypothetical protein
LACRSRYSDPPYGGVKRKLLATLSTYLRQLDGNLGGWLAETTISEAHLSADGQQLALVASYGAKFGCWDPEIDYQYIVLDLPSVRARLASR